MTALGNFGNNIWSDKDDMLVVFVELYNLQIINTFFDLKGNTKLTWKIPNCVTKNGIVFLLTLNKEKNQVLIKKSKSSKHRMLKYKLHIDTVRTKERKRDVIEKEEAKYPNSQR